MQAACKSFSTMMGMEAMIATAALACGAAENGGRADPCASAPCLNGGACAEVAPALGTGHRLLQGEVRSTRLPRIFRVTVHKL
jgi:hypothetical protein